MPSTGRTRKSIMKVNEYYSINPTDPDVYHDHNDCPSGSQIPDSNKRYGRGPTGGYRRCLTCTNMG
jgi:hypothetical protein